MTSRQPFLHDQLVVLRAPSQVWSARSGEVGRSGGGSGAAVQGAWLGDTRYLRALWLRVDGVAPEHVATVPLGPSVVQLEGMLRDLGDPGADVDVRVSTVREVGIAGVTETVRITSRLDRVVTAVVELSVVPDATGMDAARAGLGPAPAGPVELDDEGARWTSGSVEVALSAPGARVEVDSDTVTARWEVEVPARGSTEVVLRLHGEHPGAVVLGVERPASFGAPEPAPTDDRLARWLQQALADLEALRLRRPGGADVFMAAGAPWFLTLFGRDSIWAARFLLPLDRGLEVAGGTLRVLAALQGAETDPATAEQPGKIMHELRQQPLVLHGGGFTLPPLYYGTIDATALWVCLLHDAWRHGLPEDQVQALLPHLEAALVWLREHGDSDGDGLLEYVDETGQGLANQGWKDSGDSVQFRDGRLAEGPIALCEVQAYAYEAATHGADLLEAFGRPGAAESRAWAARLADRFREAFWVSDEDGPYPAIALDAAKRPVDSLTSNIGHLLGTGLLDAEEEALVAGRLVDPVLAEGFGLRTLSSLDTGFWPLSYHGGSVWTHDTAIAVTGLARAGFHAEAALLAEGLLAAAPAFDHRMPELHAGDARRVSPTPVPYPAACRPQAWSAAAAVAVWSALAGTA
ncbi:glycogen debranching N-terminal domain-containing protein [Auraticoccus monumenti]|uniref:Glycogen debranching enzyme (Alpha-1,6-glucosidase) n=1 Tax=Auraticoccus monumenti TaxID=675864 RepID=A0A1G6WJN1_9ACTN|nr:glycogen debranching N-terminal domain-containing protein [Auraticoccus monumenti]SDD66008.1 Glycogen debranching enzyme (alpha-1,6-glucosidase) [Auraticoccus monumenti]